jgi:probable F420-dependent oxidoreductase
VAEVRPFRFGTASFQPTRSGVLADARKAESQGYDIFLMADHLEVLPPITALVMLAENIGLRLGTCVLCNDFRHPVVMAKEAATLDLLSEGRFELGLGAGWVPEEYRMAGIPFEDGATRFERLAEAVQIAKLAFPGTTFSFEGKHYQVRDYTPSPPAVQQPRPPLMVGGGGRRLLSFAAAEADIVSILPASVPVGGLRASQVSLRSLKEKSDLVRAAAGTRWTELEVNVLIWDAVVTTDRRAAAATYERGRLEEVGFVLDEEVTADDLLDSPYFAFGTNDDIAEHLVRVREDTGTSYFGVFPHLMDVFEPIVAKLHGL